MALSTQQRDSIDIYLVFTSCARKERDSVLFTFRLFLCIGVPMVSQATRPLFCPPIDATALLAINQERTKVKPPPRMRHPL